MEAKRLKILGSGEDHAATADCYAFSSGNLILLFHLGSGIVPFNSGSFFHKLSKYWNVAARYFTALFLSLKYVRNLSFIIIDFLKYRGPSSAIAT
jgi:hypothetical protein